MCDYVYPEWAVESICVIYNQGIQDTLKYVITLNNGLELDFIIQITKSIITQDEDNFITYTRCDCNKKCCLLNESATTGINPNIISTFGILRLDDDYRHDIENLIITIFLNNGSLFMCEIDTNSWKVLDFHNYIK